jgi:hypothetical protein
MELAYAGLHQLLGPMLDRVERLPSAMRYGQRQVSATVRRRIAQGLHKAPHQLAQRA